MPVDANHRTPVETEGQRPDEDSSSADGQPTRANTRCLILVARDEAELWRYMAEHYGRVEGLQVLLDRRQGERRKQVESYEPERRIAHRRHPPKGEDDLRHHPFVVITQ